MSKEWSEQYRQSSMKVYHWKTRNGNDDNLPSLLIAIQLLDIDLGRNLTSFVLWLDWKYFLARQGKSYRAYCEWITDLYSSQSEKGKILFQLDLRGDCLLDTHLEIITSRFLHFSWESSQSSWYEKVWILTYWQ